MPSNLNRKIEIAANLAILVVAILLAAFLVKNYFHASDLSATQGPPTGRQTQLAVGSRLPSLDVDWHKSKQTLVLALSSNCHFCTDSAPFYRTLLQNKKETRVVAVLPQTVEEANQYLQKLGVNVDEIRQLQLDKIGVRGTPTLILLDRDGSVKNSWAGRLPEDKQTNVLGSYSDADNTLG